MASDIWACYSWRGTLKSLSERSDAVLATLSVGDGMGIVRGRAGIKLSLVVYNDANFSVSAVNRS